MSHAVKTVRSRRSFTREDLHRPPPLPRDPIQIWRAFVQGRRRSASTFELTGDLLELLMVMQADAKDAQQALASLLGSDEEDGDALV